MFFTDLQIVYKHFCKLNKIFRAGLHAAHVACNVGAGIPPIAIATVSASSRSLTAAATTIQTETHCNNLEIQETAAATAAAAVKRQR